jgi:hypothetical protein
MPRFLIEAHHEKEPLACARAVKVFQASGSHYLTNTDWGCLDGHHTTWLVVDVDNREQARALLPAAYRSQARIVGLNKFSMEQIDAIVAKHQG